MKYDKDLETRTGIFVFKNAFTKELCEETIRLFENTENKVEGVTSEGSFPDFKKSIDWLIEEGDFHSKLTEVFDSKLNEISDVYPHLKAIHFHPSGLQVQKSIVNEGYFKEHCDNDEHDVEEARWLAWILYLNDVDRGGETAFRYQKYTCKPKTGTLVVFPTTWRYLHEGRIPESNDKYIISNFSCIKRN